MIALGVLFVGLVWYAFYVEDLLFHEMGHHFDYWWRIKRWSKANRKQTEDFAEQYAFCRSAEAKHVVGEPDPCHKPGPGPTL